MSRVVEKSVKRALSHRHHLLKLPQGAGETSDEATDWTIIRDRQ